MMCGAPVEKSNDYVAVRAACSIPKAREVDVPVVRERARETELAFDLVGLDDIDWKKMKSGEGKSTWIPLALETLATSTDPEDRDFAYRDLYQTTVMTHRVVTGAAAMAPFAVALLPRVPRWRVSCVTESVRTTRRSVSGSAPRHAFEGDADPGALRRRCRIERARIARSRVAGGRVRLDVRTISWLRVGMDLA